MARYERSDSGRLLVVVGGYVCPRCPASSDTAAERDAHMSATHDLHWHD